MPGNRNTDEQPKSERTPFNVRADYSEVDHDFRSRLEHMVPASLTKRINEVLLRRISEEEKEAV